MFRIYCFGKLVVFALAFLLCPLSFALADSMPSPILAFSFDNVTSAAVPDDSGSGNTYSITAYNSSGPFTPTTVDSFPGSGKAMEFDGPQEQRVEVSGTALTVSGFTIMADVNITGNDTDPEHDRWEVSEKAGSYWGNIRYGPPKVLRVGGFFSGHQTNNFTGSVEIPISTWTNVAFIFDPTTHKLQSYVNGALDHEQTQTGTLDPSITHNGIDENLVVGAKHRQGGDGEVLAAFFDGLMDNYRLYNVALTATQVAAIAGVPVTPTPTPTPPPQITLRAAERKIGGINTSRLKWREATSTDIDVYRDGTLIVTTPNDGSYIDSTGDTGRARYTYQVCEAGTQTCSNEATVTFPQ
jgi:hypothetical protein